MRLRIRLPNGTAAAEFQPTAVFGDLVDKVVELSHFVKSEFSVKCGFPPKEVMAVDSMPLHEVLREGDLVIVHRDRVATPPAAEAETPQTPNSKQPGIRKRKGFNIGGSEEECSLNLLNVFNKSGGNLTKAQKMMKGAFKNAVERRIASNLAEHRWAAARTDSAEFQDSGDGQFSVSFQAGGRSPRVESYHVLPVPFLSLVLREVYNSGDTARRNLRPHYMAEGQPLVFWNIVKHFRRVPFFEGLKAVMHFVEDWQFYSEDRERLPSAKAKENVRQREEAKRRRLARRERRQARGELAEDAGAEGGESSASFGEMSSSSGEEAEGAAAPPTPRKARSRGGRRLGQTDNAPAAGQSPAAPLRSEERLRRVMGTEAG